MMIITLHKKGGIHVIERKHGWQAATNIAYAFPRRLCASFFSAQTSANNESVLY